MHLSLQVHSLPTGYVQTQTFVVTAPRLSDSSSLKQDTSLQHRDYRFIDFPSPTREVLMSLSRHCIETANIAPNI